jgi:uncharacterized protein (TIGR02265 family)
VTSSDFVEPDWSAPLDVESSLARIPKGATIKGNFVSAIVKAASAKGHALSVARDRYLPFHDYPLREQAELLVEAAPVFFPDRPLRHGLRLLGRSAMPIFREMTVGKVLLAQASDPMSHLEVCAKGYGIVYPNCSVSIIDPTPKATVIRIERIYNFLDSHHVGVFEGCLTTIGVRPTISVRMKSPIEADFLCRW